MTLRRSAVGIMGALLLAGCGTQVLPEANVVVDGVPVAPCITHPAPGPGPFLQCPLAVGLAAAELNLFSGTVSAVEFHLGGLCPPNARCRKSTEHGAVMFWFEGAAPVLVRISPDGSGGYVAEEPEAPPQWLLDQGPAAAIQAT